MVAARLDAIRSIEGKFREQLTALDFKGEAHWIVEESARPDAGALGALLRHAAHRSVHHRVLDRASHRRSARAAAARRQADHHRAARLQDPAHFKEEAAVAWDGSRNAARALTDAMQILETKKKLYILSGKSEKHGRDLGELPGLDLTVHLTRHGMIPRCCCWTPRMVSARRSWSAARRCNPTCW